MKQISLRTVVISAALVLVALSGWLVQGVRAADSATSERVFVTNDAALHSVPVTIQGKVPIKISNADNSGPMFVDTSIVIDSGHSVVGFNVPLSNGQFDISAAVDSEVKGLGWPSYRILSIQASAPAVATVFIAH